MIPARPLYANDWRGLAAVAAMLRDQRAGYYPEGDARTQRMATVAAAWAAIVAGEPFEGVAVDWSAIRADLASTATEAKRRADDSPGNTRARQLADALAAIVWHFEPIGGSGTPNLLFCHATTLALHARGRAAKAIPAPAIVQTPRAPRQAALAPAVAGGQHKGLALFEHAA